jgi:hypothetical protein
LDYVLHNNINIILLLIVSEDSLIKDFLLIIRILGILAIYSIFIDQIRYFVASAKSKGALLVSAIEPIKNIKNKGNIGKIKLTILWASVITIKFKLPVNNITNNITEVNINS